MGGADVLWSGSKQGTSGLFHRTDTIEIVDCSNEQTRLLRLRLDSIVRVRDGNYLKVVPATTDFK